MSAPAQPPVWRQLLPARYPHVQALREAARSRHDDVRPLARQAGGLYEASQLVNLILIGTVLLISLLVSGLQGAGPEAFTRLLFTAALGVAAGFAALHEGRRWGQAHPKLALIGTPRLILLTLPLGMLCMMLSSLATLASPLLLVSGWAPVNPQLALQLSVALSALGTTLCSAPCVVLASALITPGWERGA